MYIYTINIQIIIRQIINIVTIKIKYLENYIVKYEIVILSFFIISDILEILHTKNI